LDGGMCRECAVSHVPSLPRRAVLAGAALAPLAGLPMAAEASTSADVTSPTLLAMRRLLRDYRAAENHSMALEDLPNCRELPCYIEARAREDALEAEFHRLWAQPVTCFDDVVARAEAVQFWNSDSAIDAPADRLEQEDSDCFNDRSLVHLVKAVLELARRGHV
jgi:hypothetical protein